MVFDCRFLDNPYWLPELKQLTGKNKLVSDYLCVDKNWPAFLAKTVDLLLFLLPLYHDAGKVYFQVGFGCSGGKHRSVFAAETIACELKKFGWQLTVNHRELESSRMMIE